SSSRNICLANRNFKKAVSSSSNVPRGTIPVPSQHFHASECASVNIFSDLPLNWRVTARRMQNLKSKNKPSRPFSRFSVPSFRFHFIKHLRRKRAKLQQRATRAPRRRRFAIRPTVQDHFVPQRRPAFLREQAHQIVLDFHRVRVFGQPQPPADAAHV